MARTDPQMVLRVPAGLKARLKEAAHENNRSQNAEIVHRLELTFSKKTSTKNPTHP
jgi:hypothetical protein